MKRWLVVIITALLFIISVVFFFGPIYDFLVTNTSTLVGAIVILLLDIVFIVALFSLVSSSKQRRINTLKERLQMWTDLSFHISEAGNKIIYEFPFGLLIYGDENEIQWNNPHALEVFGVRKLIDEDIKDLNEELNDLIVNKKNKGIVEINGRIYDVINYVETRYVYLIDETDREKTKKAYNENIPALGYIAFDNLEESLASLEVSAQSSIKGEYLATVSDWVAKFDGYLKPYSDGHLVFLVYQSELEKMMIEKFDVLDKVRTISSNNELRISLSIGIACWDVDYDELGTYAQNAIDLAEKRGGDQVVVNIQNKKIEYFGAKNDATAKNSKVSVRVNAQTLRDYIKKAGQVFVMGHNNGDLDSFGAMLAIYQMAKFDDVKAYKIFDLDRLDLTVQKVLKEASESNPNHSIFTNALTTPEALSLYNPETLLIIVDTQSPKIVISPELLSVAKQVIVIDHHRVGDDGFDAIFSYIEPSASSTIELIMELMNFYEDGVNKFNATELNIMYGGLVLDTNNFTTRTGARTFEVAYRLRELGADPAIVKTWLRRDIASTLLINRLMSNATIYLNRFLFITTDEEIENRVLLAQVSDQALLIDGIDAAFTIAIVGTKVAVSARSAASVNVQLIMEHIGGGGHLNSSAAQISDTTVYQVEQRIKEYIDMEYGMEGEDMEVILLEDVKGRGKKDDVINVASGYGNFLINQGKAVHANEENLKKLSDAKLVEKEKIEHHLDLMNKLKSEIDGKNVTVEIQIGKDGKLFGSITTKQISEEFEKQNGILLDKKKIELSSDINSIGIYSASVTLYRDIKASFEINVIEKKV